MSGAGGTEVYFYHLERRSLEQTLPTLLQLSLKRGWRAVVQAASEERVEALNTLLWTYDEESFLPHGSARDGNASAHPIYLTAGLAVYPRRLCVRRPRRRSGFPRARRVAGSEGARRCGQLLAAGCRRALAAKGVKARLSDH
jgi:DNA polymerase III chi subunit, HolC